MDDLSAASVRSAPRIALDKIEKTLTISARTNGSALSTPSASRLLSASCLSSISVSRSNPEID
jgi:hypothetical protein